MTAIEVMKRDELDLERNELNSEPEAEHPENLLPLPSTASAVVEGSRKRTRKHIMAYQEAFKDSQEDPTAGIKRERVGGIL